MKLILSASIALFLPNFIHLYYQSFLFDVFALMYIHSYSKGDLKKLQRWYKGVSAKGKMIREKNDVIDG
ncbi:hypothetical protein [Carboxylicivirga sp. RSCT41]|uniref:hypothetical protein n=1 Tax=Carboxylicivirga agarovorans TaxID=3417570 RepID=UPI003D353D76